MPYNINRWQQDFATSARGQLAKLELEKMLKDPRYDIRPTYKDLWGNEATFVEKHLNYLKSHPLTGVEGYMSNLRLMTKSRKQNI